ncbi:MAG: MarR family transcriptional regulator, partial [Alphaproteobacteria bacterium]|nr:MarR family transcriptional regulator [Alphaproteobacteria bacterium]
METTRENWQQVLVSLRKIIRATDLHSKRLIKECGLTIPQLLILRAINELGDVTLGMISDHVSLSQATVTTIINRLEERGLLTRIRSTKDKRKIFPCLTPAGIELIESAPPLLHETFIDRFSSLQDWEQNQILSSLQRVASMMDASHIDAGPLLDTQPVIVDAKVKS